MTVIVGLVNSNKENPVAYLASDKMVSFGHSESPIPNGKLNLVCPGTGLPLLWGGAGTAAQSSIACNYLNKTVAQYLYEKNVKFVPHEVLRHIVATMFRTLGGMEMNPVLLNFDGVSHDVFSSDGLGCIVENTTTKYASAGSGRSFAIGTILGSYNDNMTDEETFELVKKSIESANLVAAGCGFGMIIYKIDAKGEVSVALATNEYDVRHNLSSFK